MKSATRLFSGSSISAGWWPLFPSTKCYFIFDTQLEWQKESWAGGDGKRNWAVCVLWLGDVGMLSAGRQEGLLCSPGKSHALRWSQAAQDMMAMYSALSSLLFLLLAAFKESPTSFLPSACSLWNLFFICVFFLLSLFSKYFSPQFLLPLLWLWCKVWQSVSYSKEPVENL